MVDPPTPSVPSLEARVLELEMLLTHLDRTLEDLSVALVGQQKRIDALTARLSRLGEQINTAAEPEAPRTLEDDKPPHY